MIFLCGALQPLGGKVAMLLGGIIAPCAKGLLNPCDDAQHSVVQHVAGHAIISVVEEVDGRGGAWSGWHAS